MNSLNTKTTQQHTNWIICQECLGRGKKSQKLSKKARLNLKKLKENYLKSNKKETPSTQPKANQNPCSNCKGTGLISSNQHAKADQENYPHVAIIGGGIGGVALAVACLHRCIPFTLYERDSSFNARAQGYGLTLQQASNAIKGFGITKLPNAITSTKHIVHTTNGNIIGEWGMRKWMQPNTKTNPKRTNIHIPRQALRQALLDQLNENNSIQWNHQLTNFKISEDKTVALTFTVNKKIKHAKADLVVGADGIRSTVRKLLFKEKASPLNYLGCIVILGICPLKNLKNLDTNLLDSETVFQTVNGKERIYIMPYTKDAIMWQLSFPTPENEAKTLSKKGKTALKLEAIKKTQWHTPIPQIVEATLENQISGYPVYDRELLQPELLNTAEKITLLGDAAHPMSPFKGQGANQALLDALTLARGIYIGCKPLSNWKKDGIRKRVLTNFESEMLIRTATKVKDSAKAAELLHTDSVLNTANEPRGRLPKT